MTATSTGMSKWINLNDKMSVTAKSHVLVLTLRPIHPLRGMKLKPKNETISRVLLTRCHGGVVRFTGVGGNDDANVMQRQFRHLLSALNVRHVFLSATSVARYFLNMIRRRIFFIRFKPFPFFLPFFVSFALMLFTIHTCTFYDRLCTFPHCAENIIIKVHCPFIRCRWH